MHPIWRLMLAADADREESITVMKLRAQQDTPRSLFVGVGIGALGFGGLVFGVFMALAGCGGVEDLKDSEVSDEIVGGSNTTIETHPWQISLQDTSGFHFCGGSIIDASWILTAAHCVDGSSASSMRVVAGVTRKSQSSSGQIRTISEVIMFPGYETSEEGKDAALLHLSSPLDLSGTRARAIAIATPEDRAAGLTDPGVNAIVTGWGTTRSGSSSSPDTLQGVTVPLVSNADANEAYGGGITDDQLAAGVLGVGGRDSCQGDSGGPLTVPNAAGTGRILAGIVSWGQGCALPDFPGMYGRVSSFNAWIQTNLGTITPPPPPPNTCPLGPFNATDVPLNIPDNSTTGARSNLAVTGGGRIVSVTVSANIRHTYRGDLVVTVLSPNGTPHVLHNRTGGSADDVVVTNLAVTTFNGQNVDGTWTLLAQDRDAADTGSIRSWSLSITGDCSGGTTPPPPPPTGNWSGSAQPNLRTVDNGSACTTIEVAQSGQASAVRLDVSGRHDFRSILRGTLEHNGVTRDAFPTGTFARGSGTFSFTSRAVSGFTGDATGTWRLCIIDTDAFGDTGTLETWSVHN